MRALLIQHGGEAEVLPIDMEAQTKAELNQKAHSALILCLANIEVKFKDADLLLLLLTSLPASYEHLVDTLLFGRESLALDDVMATLNSKEIKERSKAKGGDGEGLYVRRRTDRRDSRQLRGKPRSKSRGGRLKCYIFQSKDHLKRNCTKNNHKQLIGYVKKDDHPSSSGSIYDDYKVIMVMSAKECDGGSVLLGDNKECKIRGHLTVVGTPQQNEVAERMNNTLMDKMWSGHPSDYGILRIFGCVAYPHDKQGKLELRAIKCILLGYPEGVKGYRLYRLDDESPKIVTNRNVVFNESVIYKDTLKDSDVGADKSVKELQVEVELQRLNNHTPDEDQTNQEDDDDEDAGDQETNETTDLTDISWLRIESERKNEPFNGYDDESNMAAYALFTKRKKILMHRWTYQEAVFVKIVLSDKGRDEGVQKPRLQGMLVARRFPQRPGFDYE
ncbi:retrotransposon protein, putative, ty1-copia subclass [Tanacetum coccineum]